MRVKSKTYQWRIELVIILGLIVLAGCRRQTPIKDNTLIFDGHQVTWQEFVQSGARCATPPASLDEALTRERRLEDLKISKTELEQVKAIKVYFHVINKGDHPVDDGNVSDQKISNQMAVLNAKFATTRFRFELGGKPDRTTNPEWYDMIEKHPEEAAAMQKLGVKQKDVLNVYTARISGTLGWGVYPWEASAARDGVVVRFSTLPPGTADYYDEGMTLVHEVGHWLGLSHTFEGGCLSPDDHVDDTPREKEPAGTPCPSYGSRDSCPDPGYDPVNNFMDLTADACVNRFTPGQSTRMDQMFAAYRRHP